MGGLTGSGNRGSRSCKVQYVIFAVFSPTMTGGDEGLGKRGARQGYFLDIKGRCVEGGEC